MYDKLGFEFIRSPEEFVELRRLGDWRRKSFEVITTLGLAAAGGGQELKKVTNHVKQFVFICCRNEDFKHKIKQQDIEVSKERRILILEFPRDVQCLAPRQDINFSLSDLRVTGNETDIRHIVTEQLTISLFNTTQMVEIRNVSSSRM